MQAMLRDDHIMLYMVCYIMGVRVWLKLAYLLLTLSQTLFLR